MTRIEKSVFIKASAKKIYDYLIEPSNLPEYWPNVKKVSDIKPLANGGFSTRWEYRLAGITFKGTGATIECVQDKCIVDHIKGGIDSVQKWTLKPEANGTRATFEVEYDIPTPVVGGILEKLFDGVNQRDGEKIMALLKSRMET